MGRLFFPRHTHLPFDVIAFIILKSVNYVLGHFVNYVITLHTSSTTRVRIIKIHIL